MHTIESILKKATLTAYPEPDSPLHSSIIPGVVKLFSEHCNPPASVLDVGCGSCFGAKELHSAGYDVTPISVLQSEVDAAKSMTFPAVLCEMHKTESLGRFDAVWLRHAAEHSPCPLLLLSNFADQADWLYLEVPLPMTSAFHETNPNHYSCLSERGWMNLLNQSGWKVVVSKMISFNLACGEDAYFCFICAK